MERLDFWPLRLGQTAPSEPSGVGVLGMRVWGPQGWVQEQRRCLPLPRDFRWPLPAASSPLLRALPGLETRTSQTSCASRASP